ncbi:MAG: 30S ribosomal protein S11 [Candidatus Uhrbacteria bacterium]|nr:30S ribosomal protein S11 [Candidatus Uhrbacteria bacterium]MDP3793493.1 30S ribosomal protein S11 [Candidatus Uhrbacteria bacterium]
MNTEEQKIESGEPEAEAKTPKKATKARPRKTKKTKTQITQGKAFIQATYNNTIVSLCDMNGNVLAWSSAGVVGFKGPKKATPYAASVIVRDAVQKAKDYGLKEVYVFISGVGQGREGALRAFQSNNIDVLAMKDVTPVPHNGCRPPKPRRV